MRVFLGKKPGYEGAEYVFPFIQNLISYFDKKGIYYTFDHQEDVDVALCVQWEPPLKIVKQLKKRGIKIVHRLDGRAKSVIKIYDKDDENRKINEIADWTVFQSEYVRTHTTESIKTIFGMEAPICRDVERSSTIYNGVDRNVFNETGEKIPLKGKYNILHVAFTSGIRKGVKWFVTIANLLKNNPEFHFYTIGRQEEDLLSGHLIKRYDNITPLGVIVDQNTLASYMRSCQVLLFPSKNDYCPNTVLEAMSCGLPVLYDDSGGTPELVRGGEDKAGVPINESNPIYALSVIIDNLDEFRVNAISNVNHRFTLDIMGDAYLKLFQTLINNR